MPLHYSFHLFLDRTYLPDMQSSSCSRSYGKHPKGVNRLCIYSIYIHHHFFNWLRKSNRSTDELSIVSSAVAHSVTKHCTCISGSIQGGREPSRGRRWWRGVPRTGRCPLPRGCLCQRVSHRFPNTPAGAFSSLKEDTLANC